jgi:hypothetical protein
MRTLWSTALITLAVWSLLLWEHLQGGVLSHHLRNDPELPAISNWWGGLLVPSIS